MISPNELEFLINHIVFPPKLPNADDDDFAANVLFDQVQHAARSFTQHLSGAERQMWEVTTKNLTRWSNAHNDGGACEAKILKSLQCMQPNGQEMLNLYSRFFAYYLLDTLLCNIKAQNAAVLVRSCATGTIFECWEVLATNEAVLDAKAALRRSFPGKAIFVPQKAMENNLFVEEVASSLHKLSIEQLRVSKETTWKAGNTVVEDRQTSHPRLVSEWLLSVLSIHGQATRSLSISKRTHDDVCWRHAEKPWRRSPTWLCIKTGLQLSILGFGAQHVDHAHYKNFMLFMICGMAEQMLNASCNLDHLHTLRVKLARRMAKLKGTIFFFVQSACDLAIEQLGSCMNTLWAQAQYQDVINIPRISNADISRDMILRHSNVELMSVWRRARVVPEHLATSFQPELLARLDLPPQDLPPLSVFGRANHDAFQMLCVFESWVADHYDKWVGAAIHDDADCIQVQELLQAYHQFASSAYMDDAELQSGMLLVVMELWVGLDKITTKLYPLLKLYPPEIPANLFSCLLLPKLREMQRLYTIEAYLEKRQKNCHNRYPSALGPVNSDSFGVIFYSQSPSLRSMRESIETTAGKEREKLTTLWHEKKSQYDSKMQEVRNMKCEEYIPVSGEREGLLTHRHSCQRCKSMKSANDMRIQKHEWPLPPDEVECRAVVFELQAPPGFIAWRDTTWMILHDIAREGPAVTRSEPAQELLAYAPLKEHVHNQHRRIAFASPTKSFKDAHYFRARLDMDDIFVSHGMSYRLYDTRSRRVWTMGQNNQLSLARYVRSDLPTGPYKALEATMNQTLHTQNSIISTQSKCAATISMHEYVAFGSLRAGERLQWMNLLCGLMSCDINWNGSAVVMMVRQLCFQAGSRSCTVALREPHVDLNDHHFCAKLSEVLCSTLRRIESNWKESNTGRVLLVVTQRLLTLSSSPAVKEAMLDLIHKLRQVCLGWLRRTVSFVSHSIEAADFRTPDKISRRIFDIALLVRATWDVDRDYQPELLASSNDTEDYVECSIYIHDYRDQHAAENDPKLMADVMQDRRLAVKIYRYLQNILLNDSNSFSRGIQRFWVHATFSSHWQLVPGAETWIASTIKGTEEPVHYNLITGKLLVGGKPVSQLPAAYTSAALYRAIMGSAIPDVFVSDISDMDYMTARAFGGQTIYFGIRQKELIIRSRREGAYFEALSPTLFVHDLPRLIVQETIPWMCLGDGKIEFRSCTSPWQGTPDDWVLFWSPTGQRAPCMRRGTTYLLDTQSTIGREVCDVFKHFEQLEHIHILELAGKNVEIHLPRYRLHFVLSEIGELHCRELSAVVDKDQIINTLHGLESRLVLRTGGLRNDFRKILLIPDGVVNINKSSHHVRVTIEVDDSPVVSFFRYTLDQRLGQLFSHGLLEAHLFKVYLHAITGSCMKDSFTGNTGVQEALLGLSDTLTRTATPLSARAQALLQDIASLTPVRAYYPAHLRAMQIVEWHVVLPTFCQHGGFFGAVQEICGHNQSMNILFDASILVPPYHGDLHLLERSMHEATKYYPAPVVSKVPTGNADSVYQPRDCDTTAAQTRAFEMAKLVAGWPSSLPVQTSLYEMFRGWGVVSGFGHTFTAYGYSKLLNLRIEEQWPLIFAFCRSLSQRHRYHLAVAFSLMAFGNGSLVDHLRTLLAFATCRGLKDVEAPEEEKYDLTKGSAIDDAAVSLFIDECQHSRDRHSLFLKEFDDIPIRIQQSQRQKKQHKAQMRAQVALIKRAITQSWPRREVTLPDATLLAHFDVPRPTRLLNEKFDVWFTNRNFQLLCQEYESLLRNVNGPIDQLSMPTLTLSKGSYGKTRAYPIAMSLLQIMELTTIEYPRVLSNGLDGNLANEIMGEATHPAEYAHGLENSVDELNHMIADILDHPDSAMNSYGRFMARSIKAYEDKVTGTLTEITLPNIFLLHKQLNLAQMHVKSTLAMIASVLSPKAASQMGLKQAGLWPEATELNLLQLLSASRRQCLPKNWLKVLLDFACQITALQRIERMIKYLENKDVFALRKEVENTGHDSWTVADHPDWVLLEIQNDILIRPVQVRVAEEILKKENGAVLLGMGEGKTVSRNSLIPLGANQM